MPNVLYRFRSTERLIEDGELENQEIFFAAPEQLNDPMEGFTDIFWDGDSIVWNNLFKHYALCLLHYCFLFLLSGDVQDLNNFPIKVFANQNEPPTQNFAAIYEEVCSALFDELPFNKASELLSGRQSPVRRNELIQYLGFIHIDVIKIVFRILETKELAPEIKSSNLSSLSDSLMKLIELANVVAKKHENSDTLFDALASASRHVNQQIELINYYNAPDETILDRNRLSLLSGFPSRYVQEIEKLAYPKWYAACFMRDCKSPSSWGYYGNGHKGACLVYNVPSEKDRLYLKLQGINGWSSSRGATRGDRVHEFYLVKYANKFVPVDFFRSLGRLPLPILESCWYKNEQGQISSCFDAIRGNEEQWREQYWQDFYQAITTKLVDWNKENEYRLILSAAMHDFSEPEDRKLKYDFMDLKGIIFGIKTSLEDKKKLMKIIVAKCKETRRNDFKFYQAAYSAISGLIEHQEMSLIKPS